MIVFCLFEWNLCRFVISCLYMYCRWPRHIIVSFPCQGLDLQRHMFIYVLPLTLPHCCVFPEPGPGFTTSYRFVISCLYIAVDPATLLCLFRARAWIYNVICRGIFCVPRVKMRDVCTFCWYWWSCWPSLFNFPFIMRVFDPTSSFSEPIRCQMFILHSRFKIEFAILTWVFSFHLLLDKQRL